MLKEIYNTTFPIEPINDGSIGKVVFLHRPDKCIKQKESR